MFEKLRKIFNFNKKNLINSKNSWDDDLASILNFKPTSSGEVISPDGAFGTLGVVFSCVERRANALSKLPLQVYKKVGDNRQREKLHPASYLLETRPNRYQTPTQFKKYIVASWLLWGNAYIEMVFDNTGNLAELRPLNPSNTRIIKDLNGVYWYQSTTKDNKPVVYSEDEIIHLPYLSNDGKIGKAPLSVARENAGNLKAMQRFEGTFYKNGTLKKGALKIPTALDKNAKEKIKEEWRNLYGGIDNAGNIAILDAGIEYMDISMPLEDAQFVLSKKLNALDIANIFNVPSFMLNDMERSTFNNVEQQNMRFLLDVLQPDCTSIEEELNYKLFTVKEAKKYYVKFNLASALRGDTTARTLYYKEMIGMGAMSINEVRALEEYDSIGELGDKHYMSLNFTTIDTLEQHQRIKGGDENGKT